MSHKYYLTICGIGGRGDCSVVHVPHMMLLGNIVVGPARVQACPARVVIVIVTHYTNIGTNIRYSQ